MTFRPTRILAALTFGLALTLLFPGYAPGQPTTDIRAKAAQLEKDLNAANQKVETLGEQLQAAQAKVDDAEARVKVAQDGINRIKSVINGRAASIYKRAGAGGQVVLQHRRAVRTRLLRLLGSDDELLAGGRPQHPDNVGRAGQRVPARRSRLTAAR